MTDTPTETRAQLELPIETGGIDRPTPRRRRRRSRTADPQLLLFAPYAQPELPLKPGPPGRLGLPRPVAAAPSIEPEPAAPGARKTAARDA